MTESIQGGSPKPAAGHRCYYCGKENTSDIRYCAECKRYQPDPVGKTVSPCPVCCELIPRGAFKCNHCSTFQSGIGRRLPTSAATISALGALASLVILLINTVAAHPRARSRTDLALVASNPEIKFFMRVSNNGNRPSFVNAGWLTLTPDPHCPPAFCSKPGAGPSKGVLELKAEPLESALINPGHVIVNFVPIGRFQTNNKPPVDCNQLDKVKMCLAFAVSEHQRSPLFLPPEKPSEPRCVPLEISSLAENHHLPAVKDVMKIACQD